MPHGPLKLDNPAFAGTLRYTHRSVSYTSRPTHPHTIQDVVSVRRSAASTVRHVPLKPTLADKKPRALHAYPAERVHIKQRARPRPSPTPAPPKTHTARRVRKHMPTPKTAVLYAAAFLLFGFGAYIGVSGFMTNKQVASQVQALQATADDTGGNTDETKPPSTEKPTPETIRKYAVSPMNPRYIDIPSLKIHARMLSMTVDKKNELQAPYGIHDAGWYNASSRPGENGAMLVDGHSGIGNTHGIFHDIHALKAGTPLVITRGDGKKFTYRVVKTEILDAKKVDMGKLLVSQDTAKPGLNLITCAGDWIPGTFSLKQRAIVYAVME